MKNQKNSEESEPAPRTGFSDALLDLIIESDIEAQWDRLAVDRGIEDYDQD